MAATAAAAPTARNQRRAREPLQVRLVAPPMTRSGTTLLPRTWKAKAAPRFWRNVHSLSPRFAPRRRRAT
jgi:hypothetical protein